MPALRQPLTAMPPVEASLKPVPLDLPRQIMRRALVVASLGVVLMAGLGLSRMQDNVREELEAARVMALLSERLTTLQAMSDEQALLALQQWRAEGPLRHLALRLQDSQGRLIKGELPPGFAQGDAGPSWLEPLRRRIAALLPPPPPFTVSWPVQRPTGPPWTVSLSADADSEQLEALQFLLESVGTVALASAGMLLVMHWNTRRAFQPLSQLLAAMAQLRAGHPEPLAALPPMPVGEMQAITDALQALARALAEAEQERQWLGQKVLTLQEDERQRLARELHDEFGQRLTALRVDAAWLARQLAGQPALLSVVSGMAAQCEGIQRDIRAVLARLQPLGPLQPGQGTHGNAGRLAELLQDLVAGWARAAQASPGAEPSPSTARIELQLRAREASGRECPWPGGDAARLPLDLMLAVYRISQEALTNVARHAGASRAVLSVGWQWPARPGEPAVIDWSVTDDGVGVADFGHALRRGNGLAGIKERIWARGADLQAGPARPGEQPPGWRLATRLNVPPPSAEPTPEQPGPTP
jgi:two-component system, NarL family, sensor histidine kinase UhpB